MRSLLFAVTVTAAACGVDSPADGLSLEIQAPDHVAGSFRHDGVEIGFDFSRSGDHHEMAFHDANGRALVSTTLDGFEQTTNVFDGQLVISGVPNMPNPTITGDEDAMDELQNRPEARLLEALDDELAAAGIDETLYRPEPPHVSGLQYETWSTGHFYIGDQESMVFLSAAGAAPTYVYLRKYTDNPGQISIWYSPWSGASSGFLSNSTFGTTAYMTKYWWGAAFRVTCISTIYNACRVRVSPYTWSEF